MKDFFWKISLLITKGLKTRTIKVNFIIALIFTTVVPASLINFFYYARMNTFVENKVEEYYTEIVKQTGTQIDNLYSQIVIAQGQLLESAITCGIFQGYEAKEPIDQLASVRQIERDLKKLKRSFPLFDNLFMIAEDGRIFSADTIASKYSLFGNDWIKNAEKYRELSVIPPHADNYTYPSNNTTSKMVISFIKRIIEPKNEKITGTVQIDLNCSEMEKIFGSLNFSGKNYILILDANQNIIYFNDQLYVGKNLEELAKDQNYINIYSLLTQGSQKNNLILSKYEIPKLDWTVNGIIYTETISEEFTQLKKISITILILVGLFSIFLAYILSYEILKPISKLIQSMKKVGAGDFNIQLPRTNNADLQVLTESFNVMVGQVNQLMKNVLIKEDEKRLAELKTLQSQINSHFLYNTLNTIKWMAIMEKSDPIVNAIVSLVKILEYTTKNLDRFVSIEDEIAFTKDYVLIQQMRTGKEIPVHYDLDDELKGHSILKLALQPLIENAFLHAFHKLEGNEVIWVTGRVEDKRLIFEVKDNGVGMDEFQKEKLTGIGMDNVNTRIKLNFGNEFGLSVHSAIGKGTNVKLVLPNLLYEEDSPCIQS